MTPLSRRENEVLDCVYRLGRPTAKAVMQELDDGASYSTIRTLLNNLVDKGRLTREAEGLKYLYVPIVKREAAAKKAMKHLVSTFFDDSPLRAVNSFLDLNAGTFTEDEIEQLKALLSKKRKNLNKKK